MPFYEVIYESGAHSVACYADDEEAASAVEAHHQRAKTGEKGGPTGHPAERVVSVLRYTEHPVDASLSQLVDKDRVKELVAKAIESISVGNQVSIPEVAAAVRDMSSPLLDSGPHESNYATKEEKELNGKWGNN